MIARSNKLRARFLCLLLLCLFSFHAAPCSATVNKSTAVVRVSTSGEDNWYDWYASKIVSSSNPLHTWATCAKTGCTSNNTDCKNKYTLNGYCNTSYGEDFLYTDTEDETNTYLTSSNFTISASASASSGSMSGVKIQWLSEPGTYGYAAKWGDSSYGAGEYTCLGTGSCTVCVQGGSCAHPVIPQSALGVHSDGSQRRFYFRAVFSSSSGDSVATGFDSTLDKYFWFVICGPKCSGHTCGEHAPSVYPASVNTAANLCNGLNDSDAFYTVNWNYAHMPSNTGQTFYKVSIRKAGTSTVLNSYSANSAATSFKIPSSWITYGTSYEWQVEARFSGQGCSWDVYSPWSSGGTNINVPARYPVPSFTVRNPSSANCLANSCLMAENLTFDGSGSGTYSGGTTTYSWVVDGAAQSGASFVKNFASKPHTAKLTVRDGGGRSCSLTKSFTLGDAAPSCATGLSTNLGSVFSPADWCAGLNDASSYYALTWSTSGNPAGSSQSHYKVSVRNASSGAIQTAEADSSSTMFQVPTAWISYGQTYDWKVDVVFTGGGCSWNLSSPWSSGGTSINVPARYPSPVMAIKNPAAADCFSGACRVGEDITFDASASSVFAGSPTYGWMVDGAARSGSPFSQNFTTKPHTASLTVTDGLGRSCSTPLKNFNLGDPVCASGLQVNPSNLTQVGSFCDGLYYAVSWQNSGLPAGATQVSYTVTVVNQADASDSHSATASSSLNFFSIPGAWLSYGQTYTWKVDTVIRSADGLCNWNLSSGYATGALLIVTPHKYPVPSFTVRDADGVDCLTADCYLLSDITFDASSSAVYQGSPTYLWNLDGESYSTSVFSKKFTDRDHTVSLTVKDGDGHSCTSSGLNLNLDKASATWNEVAPK